MDLIKYILIWQIVTLLKSLISNNIPLYYITLLLKKATLTSRDVVITFLCCMLVLYKVYQTITHTLYIEKVRFIAEQHFDLYTSIKMLMVAVDIADTGNAALPISYVTI